MVKSSSFGQVWLGKEKHSAEYVAIWIVKSKKSVKEIEAKMDTCLRCASNYLVRCIEERPEEDETWVGLLPVNSKCRLCWSIPMLGLLVTT